MKIINKPHYRCDHCNKLYLVPSACEKHETKCSKNPINFKPCLHCHYLDKKDVQHYWDNPMGGTDSRDLSMFYCTKKDFFVFPKEKHFEQEDLGDGETEIIPMPKTCDVFNDGGNLFNEMFNIKGGNNG